MADTKFPVVCLGASAGGVEACIRLLGEIPSNAGVAIVIVNHRRTGPTMLPEILAGRTFMPALLILEGMPLERNHIYVIPPNCDLTLSADAFHLSALSKPYGWPRVVTAYSGACE